MNALIIMAVAFSIGLSIGYALERLVLWIVVAVSLWKSPSIPDVKDSAAGIDPGDENDYWDRY